MRAQINGTVIAESDETIVVEGGLIVERHRLPVLPEGAPQEQSLEAALSQLDEILHRSVELHQRSDVPYGMFLSGGIDSSVMLAMMKRLNVEPVHAFTVGFSGGHTHDERDQARAVAHAVGAQHTEIEFTEQDFWTIAPGRCGNG